MSIEVHVLGGFALTFDGQGVRTVHAPRTQALIAYLALHLDTGLPRSHLAYLFWPDSTEAQAHTNLRKSIYLMKQALPPGQAVLELDAASITLKGQGVWVDALQFSSCLDEAVRARRSGDPNAEQAALEKAVALYRGELLPGLYDEWIIPERERLRSQQMQALDRLSALSENRQYYRDAIRHAEQLLEYDSLREETYQRLMRLYALIGDRAASLHTYHRCVTRLREELSASPALETREAYARIMQLDGAIPGPEAGGPKATAKLVGREAEWKQLQLIWRETVRGKSQLALISGEAGIGKTRLADEMLDWARRQGYFAARAVCYAAEGSLAFAPVTAWLAARPLLPLEPHWLTEIARLVPDTIKLYPQTPPPGPMTEPWQRQHLFEALARGLLEAPQPILCLLDNIQWCDADTLQWLHFLMRFEPRAKLLVLATSRPEDFGDATPGVDFLASLAANEQLLRLDLGRFDEAHTSDLAGQIAGRPLAAEEATALFRETEGVPLFIVEAVREAQGEQALTYADRPSAGHPLPSKVQAVIAQRLSRLSPTDRETLEAAAVIGRGFSLDLLRFTAQLSESILLQALDDLWKQRLINEVGNVYDFGHDRIRETVYAGIEFQRRSLLHRRVAEALESRYSRQLGAVSARIAAHLQQGGQTQRAVGYYRQAARQAQQVFAADEALKHIQQALNLNRESEILPDLYEEQGDLLAFQQRHEQAGIAYREALIACPQADWLRRARLHRKYSVVFARVDNELAEQALRLAGNSLQNVADRSQEYWHEWIEFCLARLEASYWHLVPHELTALLAELAPTVEAHGDVSQQIRHLSFLIKRNYLRDNFHPDEETIQMTRRYLELQDSTGDLAARALGLQYLGFILQFAGQLEEAEQCLRESWETCVKTGDHSTLLIALCYLSLTHRRESRVEDVRADMDALEEALAKSSVVPYEAMVNANRAWLAYRQGDWAEARLLAQRAVDVWATAALPYPIQWPAWTILLALATEDGEAAKAQSYLSALVSPGKVGLDLTTEQELHSDLEACLQNPEVALRCCEEAVVRLKEAGYL